MTKRKRDMAGAFQEGEWLAVLTPATMVGPCWTRVACAWSTAGRYPRSTCRGPSGRSPHAGPAHSGEVAQTGVEDVNDQPPVGARVRAGEHQGFAGRVEALLGRIEVREEDQQQSLVPE